LTGAVQSNAGDDRLRWTSVPRWPAARLPAAASYLACCFGEAGEQRAAELLADADPAVPVRSAVFAARWDEAAEARLRRVVGDCLTGVRIILAGPESAVMAAAAVARQLGAVSEELVLAATEIAGPAGPGGPAGNGQNAAPGVAAPGASAAGNAAPSPAANGASAAGNAAQNAAPSAAANDASAAGSAPESATAPPRDRGAYVDGRAARRVFCADCRAPFDARAALGDLVTCPGCAAALTVDYRFSRPHAAYFGWPAGLDLHR
jgi:hypothetical protein